MKVLITHPTANSNVRAIAHGLNSKNMLHSFHTTIAAFPGNFWDKLSAIPGLGDFSRRNFEPGLRSVTSQNPGLELGRMVSSKLDLTFLAKHEKSLFSIDRVYSRLDKKVSKTLIREKENIDAVYAYEDGALESFKTAKRNGIFCIYDLPIAYWQTTRRLLLEESERLPEWANTLGGGINDSSEKLDRKEEEMELADLVVEPSEFVKNSLPGWAKSKNNIISPFGSPISNFEHLRNRERSDNEAPLKILFVGSMGQRKGLGDLFNAMKMIDNTRIQLIVLGSLEAPLEFYKNQFDNFQYEPGRKHPQVLELMRSCDVLCLPSIIEGRALVMQEAMSQGLPLIITPNTGGEDLIIEGETGFLIPIRSPEAIAEKLEWFFKNRDEIPAMSRKAIEVSQAYTWDDYCERVINGISSLIKKEEKLTV